MNYVSTRNNKLNISGLDAVTKDFFGKDGVFLPTVFPVLSNEDVKRLSESDFPERVAFVMSLFLDEFSTDELMDLTSKAYATFDGDPCPLVNVDGTLNFLELWHGPSSSSLDLGMALLPHLLEASKKKLGDKSKNLLLVASPNLGKATLESFKDFENFDVLAFFPNDEVSAIQKLQLRSQSGNNADVSWLNESFADIQKEVNELSKDQSFIDTLAKKGYELTLANADSWGALIPRIACFVSCYIDLLTSKQIAENESFNVFLPSDDFANLLACVYAKKMGIPIQNVVCSTKEKDPLIDFFKKGVLNVKRKSNDDCTSKANLERFLFEVFGKNNSAFVELADNLEKKGKIQFDLDLILEKLPFVLVGYATDAEIKETLAVASEEFDYVADENTALALSVFDDYNFETEDDTVSVIVSTSAPFKNPSFVLEATQGIREKDELKALKKLHELTGVLTTTQIATLKELQTRFEKVIDKREIKKSIFDYLGE